MPIFTRDDRALLFVHIPKTGGTTIEKMLVSAGWRMGFHATRLSEPEQFHLYKVSPQHFHADLLRQLVRPRRFDLIFAISREPLARFRSEYAMRNREAGAGTADRVEEWTDRVLRRYRQNPFHLDNHLRPQHEFVLPRTRVFRLEDGMESIIGALNVDHGLGLPSVIPRHMQGSSRGVIGSADVQVNGTVEARVRELYAEDFRTFGYA